MACTYGFSSPQTSFGQRNFSYPVFLQPRTTHLRVTQFSLQDSVSVENHNLNSTNPRPSQNPDKIKKNYVWVNPKSSKSSEVIRKSTDYRYTSLATVAESLDSCMPVERDVFDILDANLGGKLVEEDAKLLINNMSNPENAEIVLRYFQGRGKLTREVVLYNVVLKVCMKRRDLPRTEKLFDEMLQRGLKPDDYTFSTIIWCAKTSSSFGKAVEWFDMMPDFGIEPDDPTSAPMVSVYGKAGMVEKSLRLYDSLRTKKWKFDCGTFITIIRIHMDSGNFDGCLAVFEEMKAIGVKPNLVCYNVMLDAMGKAKRPWGVRSIYRQILKSGLTPSWATYAAQLRGYCKARYHDDAMEVYREVKAKGMEVNQPLYNSLLVLCADVGFLDEALEIFEDMKRSKNCEPDSWTFSSMIALFSSCGKVSEAEAMLKEMLEAGFETNIYVLTSLIQGYGKTNRADDVVRTFDRIIELGITPTDQLCTCLLDVMAQTPREELSKLMRCMEKAHSKLGNIVKLLVEEGSDVEDETFKREARELLTASDGVAKKAFCNCLIDLCINVDQWGKACELLDLGLTLELYEELQSKSPTAWTLNLRSLSVGAALTAFHIWINDLSKAMKEGEELPSLLGINTGSGKHKYSSKGLAKTFQSHLKELNAPFHEAPEKVGWFFTTKVAALLWLETRNANVVAAM